jgi:hypothetical protein
MIQYAVRFEVFIHAGDYWIPAFAGMTAVFVGWPACFSAGNVGVSSHTRIGIST